MKKWSLIVMLVLVLALTACGGGGDDSESDGQAVVAPCAETSWLERATNLMGPTARCMEAAQEAQQASQELRDEGSTEAEEINVSVQEDYQFADPNTLCQGTACPGP